MNRNRKIWQKLIAIEGIDGAGTTTLAQNLTNALELKSIPSVSGCEPTDGPVGSLVRKALSGRISFHPKTLAMLFAADRREHIYGLNGIQTQINIGKIYITDRYFFSSLAYQSLDADWDWVDYLNCDFPLPGYLVYLELPVKEARKRISNRGKTELFDHEHLQHRISDLYQKSIDAFRKQGMKILKLDSRLKPEEVCDATVHFLKDLL